MAPPTEALAVFPSMDTIFAGILKHMTGNYEL
jgi:hypothetical protein